MINRQYQEQISTTDSVFERVKTFSYRTPYNQNSKSKFRLPTTEQGVQWL